MSAGFIGLTLHWIHVDESEKWSLKSAVIGMRGLSGNHSGKNIGQFDVGLCDRVGLIGKVQSKVHFQHVAVTLTYPTVAPIA